jgi:hypothetical protein
MSDTSTNPVQNKVVKKYIDDEVVYLEGYAERVANDAEGYAKKYTDEKVRENKGRIDAIEPIVSDLSEKMDTLMGTGEGSIVEITNKEVANVIDSTPEAMDILKEVTNLIEKDAEQAADILATLGRHETRIETLENRIILLSEAEYENLAKKEDKFYFCYEE